jgi:YVTN family beta-propeller protein
VTPIIIATGKTGVAIKVGTYPEMIAITCDGKTAYVMNDASNTVTPITIATGKAGSAIKVGTDPDTIVIMPVSPG